MIAQASHIRAVTDALRPFDFPRLIHDSKTFRAVESNLSPLFNEARSRATPVDVYYGIPNPEVWTFYAIAYLTHASEWTQNYQTNHYDEYDPKLVRLKNLIDMGHAIRHALHQLVPADYQGMHSGVHISKLIQNVIDAIEAIEAVVDDDIKKLKSGHLLQNYDPFKEPDDQAFEYSDRLLEKIILDGNKIRSSEKDEESFPISNQEGTRQKYLNLIPEIYFVARKFFSGTITLGAEYSHAVDGQTEYREGQNAQNLYRYDSGVPAVGFRITYEEENGNKYLILRREITVGDRVGLSWRDYYPVYRGINDVLHAEREMAYRPSDGDIERESDSAKKAILLRNQQVYDSQKNRAITGQTPYITDAAERFMGFRWSGTLKPQNDKFDIERHIRWSWSNAVVQNENKLFSAPDNNAEHIEASRLSMRMRIKEHVQKIMDDFYKNQIAQNAENESGKLGAALRQMGGAHMLLKSTLALAYGDALLRHRGLNRAFTRLPSYSLIAQEMARDPQGFTQAIARQRSPLGKYVNYAEILREVVLFPNRVERNSTGDDLPLNFLAVDGRAQNDRTLKPEYRNLDHTLAQLEAYHSIRSRDVPRTTAQPVSIAPSVGDQDNSATRFETSVLNESYRMLVDLKVPHRNALNVARKLVKRMRGSSLNWVEARWEVAVYTALHYRLDLNGLLPDRRDVLLENDVPILVAMLKKVDEKEPGIFSRLHSCDLSRVVRFAKFLATPSYGASRYGFDKRYESIGRRKLKLADNLKVLHIFSYALAYRPSAISAENRIGERIYSSILLEQVVYMQFLMNSKAYDPHKQFEQWEGLMKSKPSDRYATEVLELARVFYNRSGVRRDIDFRSVYGYAAFSVMQGMNEPDGIHPSPQREYFSFLTENSKYGMNQSVRTAIHQMLHLPLPKSHQMWRELLGRWNYLMGLTAGGPKVSTKEEALYHAHDEVVVRELNGEKLNALRPYNDIIGKKQYIVFLDFLGKSRMQILRRNPTAQGLDRLE